MIMYYSGTWGGGDTRSFEVVFGDRACLMLSYFNNCKGISAGFKRIKRARRLKKRHKYIAWRHSKATTNYTHSETVYSVISAGGSVIAGPTPLLTSLVMDVPCGKRASIVRVETDGSHTVLYQSGKNGWVSIRSLKGE